jgi:hypothetical protein
MTDQDDRVAALEMRLRRLEDIEEIRDLKRQFLTYADTGGPSWSPEAIGELFVDDGVFRAPYGEYHGPKDIGAGIRASQVEVEASAHFAPNDSIQVDGDTAMARWGMVLPARFAGLPIDQIWILGYYHERYVRTIEGWRFSEVEAEVLLAPPAPDADEAGA